MSQQTPQERDEMILTFNLLKPEQMPKERLFALVWRARQIALELDGVYDLALYQTEYPKTWRCSVDLDGQDEWERLQADQRFKRVWTELEELGVQIAEADQLERRI
ncbi:hypothetical protein HYR54_08040 [Candidatus Acetothermia bacterium]|nr:hypothetical protein [Candidatus Acetothermia bacterium]